MFVKWMNGEIIPIENDLTEAQIIEVLSKIYPPERNYKLIVQEMNQTWMAMMVPDREATWEETRQVEERLRQAWYHDPRSYTDRMNSVGSTIPPSFEQFREALIRSHAVVAGGAVVAGFTSIPIVDLDVLVERRHVAQLLMDLLALEYELDETFKFPHPRQESLTLWTKLRLNCVTSSCIQRPPVDVLVLETAPVPRSDLSCCESVWDGRVVWSNDLYGLRHRRALFAYRDLDTFSWTSRRLNWYRDWDVEVEVERKTEEEDVLLSTSLLQRKQQEERWAIRTFLKGARMLIHTQELPFEAFVCCAYPSQMTVAALKEEWGEPLVESIAAILIVSEEMEDFFHRVLPPHLARIYSRVFNVPIGDEDRWAEWVEKRHRLADGLPAKVREWESAWKQKRNEIS